MSKYTSVIRLFDRLVLGFCGFALCLAGCDSAAKETSGNATQSQPQTASTASSNPVPEEADWSQFRGPEFTSSTSSEYRLEWAIDEGIEWKSELPGRGAATPIVVGNRIFVTAFDGFGLTVENAGELKDLRHHLLCFDKNTGQPLWQREVTGTSLLQKMNPELVRHGFASSTPVSDGQHVYVFFGVTGVFAFDLDGELLWQRNLGLETHYFGSSSSPIVYGDLLIVNASIESDTIYALDKNTGACVWTIPQVRECWSTPVIGKNAKGIDEMVVSSKDVVAGFNPTTGQPLWQASGILDYVVSVPIIVDGVCYLTGGKTKQTMAIQLGGSGDVTESHKLWEVGKIGSNVSSPVFRDGKLFIFHDSGVVQVLDAKDGAVLKRHRTATRERPFASPLLAGKHLYMPFQDAGISVFTADEDCVEVATNECSEDLPLMASIVPSGDRLYFRTDRFLYCIGPENQATVNHAWEGVSDHDVVTTIESFNIDPKKGWSRRYLGFLKPSFEKAIKFLLMPYQSVITDEQTAQARDIIMAEKPKYEALRERYEEIRQAELTTAADQAEAFHERYAQLEADTKALNSQTRILVKKLFPKEQMQQHLQDAKDGKAHIKPDGKTKKTP